jgi:hypothetical protein
MSPHHATLDEARRTTLRWAVNCQGSRRVATRDVRDLEERGIGVPPAATLRLSWPLARDFFAGGDRKPATGR